MNLIFFLIKHLSDIKVSRCCLSCDLLVITLFTHFDVRTIADCSGMNKCIYLASCLFFIMSTFKILLRSIFFFISFFLLLEHIIILAILLSDRFPELQLFLGKLKIFLESGYLLLQLKVFEFQEILFRYMCIQLLSNAFLHLNKFILMELRAKDDIAHIAVQDS